MAFKTNKPYRYHPNLLEKDPYGQVSSEVENNGCIFNTSLPKIYCSYKTDVRLNTKIHNVLVLSLGLSTYYWQLPVEC